MSEVNYDWVREQLQAVRAKVNVGKAVLALLETWEAQKLTEKSEEEVIEIFSRLALSNSLVPDAPEETWVPAQPGFIKVGDEIRVKHDAYKGKLGVLHNGRRGKVTAVRYGDIIMRSTDDKEPFLDGTHHSPQALEKRIR